MLNTVQMANSADDGWPDAELGKLDPANFAWYVDELAKAERSARRLRKRLAALIDPPPPNAATCSVCSGPMVGRADRRFCSASCRQRAHRRRHGSKP